MMVIGAVERRYLECYHSVSTGRRILSILILVSVANAIIGTTLSLLFLFTWWAFGYWYGFGYKKHILLWSFVYSILTLVYIPDLFFDAGTLKLSAQEQANTLLVLAPFVPLPVLLSYIAIRQRQNRKLTTRETALGSTLLLTYCAVNVGLYFNIFSIGSLLVKDLLITHCCIVAIICWQLRSAILDVGREPQSTERYLSIVFSIATIVVGVGGIVTLCSTLGVNLGLDTESPQILMDLILTIGISGTGIFTFLLLAQDALMEWERGLIDETKRSKSLTHQLRKQEQVLLQSEKMRSLGGLLAGVAHELNNPLAIVVGTSQVLNLDDDMSLDNKEKAGRIETAALRCKAIIRSFLDVAKPEPLEYSNFDIGHCIGDAAELTTMVLKQDYISLKINVSPDLPPIFGSPDQVTQLVINLVLNAKDAILEDKSIEKGNGEVWINCLVDHDSELIQLEVHDNGPGLPESMRKEAFEAFFTTKEPGKGTGLGLSIAGNIVHSHQGTIQFIEPDHKGACVQIKLPYSHMPMNEQRSIVDDFARRERHSILIVDDDPDALETLSDILVLMGQKVFTALSVFEGTKIFQQETVDFIITDIRMPEIDGKKFYKQIQKHRPEFIRKTAFVTGSSIDEDTKEFLRQSGRPVIEKPFAARDVGKVLDKLISDVHKVN